MLVTALLTYSVQHRCFTIKTEVTGDWCELMVLCHIM